MPEFEVESIRRSRRLLRSRSDRDDRGWTLLHIHARKGDLKENQTGCSLCLLRLKPVKRLLDKGMDVNVAAWGPKAHGTPLHNAAKERKKKAIRFLVENGAFLPDDINDTRFNPPVHYCPGLEWAYEELRRLQLDSSSSCETSCSSDN
ncbi:hypothetical protein DH2020_005935 [Rehmannia glutinosa]|uniref:Uncharacterized protein n=1 Tax=Rehmannia glutinosa TaxID=99300 RepID=A0ABR0XHJ2_REHGL